MRVLSLGVRVDSALVYTHTHTPCVGDERLATSISPACVNQAVPARYSRCSVDICSGIGNVVDSSSYLW